MKQHVKRAAVVVVGTCFVVAGLFGLVLPFLQGFLFMAIGLMLLSMTSPRFRKWLDIHTLRYPKLHSVVLRAENWILSKIGPLD